MVRISRKEDGVIIGYVSETAQDYCEQLRHVDNFQQLKDFVENWKEYAFDAWLVVKNMTPENYPEFADGLIKEKRNKVHGAGFEWQEKYAAVLLPEMLMRVSMIALKFNVPFGCAWIRCEENGLIGQNAVGAYIWIEPEKRSA
jgi:hypothetical protein